MSTDEIPRIESARRVTVVVLTFVVGVLSVQFGAEMIWWAPFRISPVFQPARSATINQTLWIYNLGWHIHSLDIWGAALVLSGALVPLIFTKRWWPLGMTGATLGFTTMTFLTITFLRSAANVITPGQPAALPHAGLGIGTLSEGLTAVYLIIMIGTSGEHDMNRKLRAFAHRGKG
jgi:hypothetical protein